MNPLALLRVGCLIGLCVLPIGCAVARPPGMSFQPLTKTDASRRTRGDSAALGRDGLTNSKETARHDVESPGTSHVVARVSLSEDQSFVQLTSGVEEERTELATEIARLPITLWPPQLAEPRAGLTLDEVINTTLHNDPVLSAGFQAVRQAEADGVTASLRPNPELEVTQTLMPLTHAFTEDRQGGPPQFDAIISYPIDWYLFGKRAATMHAAARGVKVSQAEYADLVRQRVLAVALVFYGVQESQSLLELAQQDVENLRQIEEITRIAVENGARPSVELSRIRLDRLNSEQALRETQRELTAAQAELRAAMGASFEDGAFTVAGTLEPPLSDQLLNVEDVLVTAEAQRPDVQAARWRVSQAQSNVEVQRVEAYPGVVPQVGYTRQFQRKAIGFPDTNAFGIGVSVGLPISNRNQGNQLRATSEKVQSEQELRATLVNLRAEIVSVTAELETARDNAIATAEEQLSLAEETRNSIQQAYEAGGRPLIDVLDSQRNYRETYRNYIHSRADYWRALHRFNAAVGSQILR